MVELYSVHCTVYTVQCTVYSCTLYTVQLYLRIVGFEDIFESLVSCTRQNYFDILYICILHPKIPRLLHCRNRLWFFLNIFLISCFRVLKINPIVLLYCPDMGIHFGVIPYSH